jgi:hypothetical protein
MPVVPDTLLTISLNNGVYSVSSDPCVVSPGGKLAVTIPQGPPVGCLICLNKDLGSSKSHNLLQDKTFDMSNYPNASAWTYYVYAPNGTCPPPTIANPPHAIQIGS